MSYDALFNVSGMGMKAQMLRMEVVSSNIANVNTTRSPEGGPFRRREVVFETADPQRNGFENALLGQESATLKGVEVSRVTEDPSPFMRKYEPEHPDAGPDGYVLYPNINIVSEMVNLQEASRSYEANLSVILSVKSMIAKTFEIGR